MHSPKKTSIESLLRELLEAQRNRKSEQLSKEQLALFEAVWKARNPEDESAAGEDDDDFGNEAPDGQKPDETQNQKRGGRQPLARHLKRERIVHDLAEAEKHCAGCGKDLRLIAEETSERYEYIPASMKVIQDVCLKYACDCTVKTADKPPQPIEKSTAGASLLAQVIVAKWADHQPLHRQEKIFERHGIEISRKTMGGWMAQCAELLDPLYQLMKKELFGSKVIGTDDTSVKVLDRKLPFARIGRIWPYVGDAHHPVIVYDYTPTRGRAGPAKFLEGYKGYLQADAYSVYDAFFKPERGMTEVGCWMHARRYFFKALESDRATHGAGAAPDRAPVCGGGARQGARCRRSRGWHCASGCRRRLLGKLHQYLLGIQRGGSAEEPVRRGGALCAESVGGADALSGRRRVWRSTTAPRSGPTGTSRWAAATGRSSAATAAARRRRCCEASSLPASGAASSRLPGSVMCSRASRRTPSPD